MAGQFPRMFVNGHAYPDPIHIATFTGANPNTYYVGSVVVADDTGELRTVDYDPVLLTNVWVTYVGSFSGGPTLATRSPFVIGTTEFTLGGGAQAVLAPNTMFPGGAGIIAIGGTTSLAYNGYIAVVQAGFTRGAITAGTTTQIVNNGIANAVTIIDSATNEQIETPLGETIFGLLQAASLPAPIPGPVVDGDAIAAAPNQNLQISFVYRQKAAPGTLVLYTLPAGTYRVSYYVHSKQAVLPYMSLVTGVNPLPDIITAVFHIPTFTARSYTEFPLGSMVVAVDSGLSRQVGPSSWIVPGNYIGAFATDGLAIAYVSGTWIDTLNNGTGLPRDGQWYWNTTTHACRRYNSVSALWDDDQQWRRTVVNGATYDTVRTDTHLAVTRTATGTCAIRLMTADCAIVGRSIDIQDEALGAGTYPITVYCEGGAERINGLVSFTIDAPGDGVQLISNGTNWFVK